MTVPLSLSVFFLSMDRKKYFFNGSLDGSVIGLFPAEDFLRRRHRKTVQLVLAEDQDLEALHLENGSRDLAEVVVGEVEPGDGVQCRLLTPRAQAELRVEPDSRVDQPL